MASALRFSTFDVSRQIFFKSKLCIGIVNLKPIVEHHVLVIPKRLAPRLADLTPDEVSDLFLSVQTIGKTIEKATNAKSLTVACQDGPYAGQSVPHVHVHILPRHPSDFEPVDKVYDELDAVDLKADYSAAGSGNPHPQTQKKEAKLKMDSERLPRSAEEMQKEAEWLASLFPDNQS